jgi:hypothetical protein
MAGLTEVTATLIERLRRLAGQLVESARKHDVDETVSIAAQMESYAELLGMSWPTPDPGDDLQNLKRHVRFSGRHGARGNWDEMRSDPTDCLTDLAGLSSRLAIVSGRIRLGLRERVEALPPGPERDFATEALVALGAGANRAAITSAGAAMESRARRTYAAVTGGDSGGMPFFEVIRELESRETTGGVRQIDLQILGILRVYRNLCAHPTDFLNADSVAPALVELACETLIGITRPTS